MVRILVSGSLILLFAVFLLTGCADKSAGNSELSSPYQGEENREIKALSSEDIEGYLNAKGMGYAKAAELNHYPGPRHVLDMSQQLDLSDEQIGSVESIFEGMQNEAKIIGARIVDQERVLDEEFASGRINEELLAQRISSIATDEGELRLVHLATHLELKSVLSEDQVEKYDELRGYLGAEGGDGQDEMEHDPSHEM